VQDHLNNIESDLEEAKAKVEEAKAKVATAKAKDDKRTKATTSRFVATLKSRTSDSILRGRQAQPVGTLNEISTDMMTPS